MDINADKPPNETRQWAVFILFLSAIGFLLSFPCRDTFLGGLLASAFGAGLVGGITDWFAVVSLFRKPLGIRFFRAVIPSKKDEIIESLANMVENDLLSPENIKKSMRDYDLTSSINDILKRMATKNIIRTFLRNIIMDLLKTQDHGIIATLIRNELLRNISNVSSSSVGLIINQVIKWSEEKKYLDKIFMFTLNELTRLLGNPEFEVRLVNIIKNVLQDYKNKGKAPRSLFITIIEPILVPAIQAKIIESIDNLKNNTCIRQNFRNKLIMYIDELQNNPSINSYIQGIISKLQANPDKISETILEIIFSFEIGIKTDKGIAKLFLDGIRDVIYDALVNITTDSQQQEFVNEFLREKILNLVSDNRHMVGKLVSKRLNSYPTGGLERMIEQRVGEDLQIIRITGTLIGGFTGTLVFVINKIFFG